MSELPEPNAEDIETAGLINAMSLAKRHVFHKITAWKAAASDDAVVQVLARTGLLQEIIEAAAPAIRDAERERIRPILDLFTQFYAVHCAANDPDTEDPDCRAIAEKIDLLGGPLAALLDPPAAATGEDT